MALKNWSPSPAVTSESEVVRPFLWDGDWLIPHPDVEGHGPRGAQEVVPDTGSVHSTPEEPLEGDQRTPGIEEQASEVLVPLRANL